MKKIMKFKLFFITISSLALGSSCTDLKVDPSDSKFVTVSAGGTSNADPKLLLETAYKDLSAYTDQANVYALGQHTSAEMIPPTRGVDWGDNGVWRVLDQHTWDGTNSWVVGSWNQLNQRVFKVGQILAANPTPAQAAEAKFLRAYSMYHVMDYWGQVPFRNVTDGVDVSPKVFPRTEAFDFVDKDLNEALAGVTKIGPSAENTKVSKAAVNAHLAKLYLNKAVYKSAKPEGPYTFDKADMTKVIAYIDAVTADGFSLENKYFDNFTKAALSEIILTTIEGSPQNRWNMTLHYSQDPSGWNGFTTIADFYAKFEDKDQRKGEASKRDNSKFAGIGKGFLRGQQYKGDGSILLDSRTKKPLSFTDDVPLSGAATDKGIRVIKYHPADANKYILQRYGELVVMKAEAQFRAGDAAGALATINALRAKRGATALSAVTETNLFDEYGRETYWEGGARTYEIRFGKFLTGPGVTKKDPGTVLFPIPSDAVTTNPNLKQNPGY
jgi:starch-binding outer membrane protein, SusD/RagB family